jgi:hypothetical protein
LADLLGIAAVEPESASPAASDQLATQGTLFDAAG